MHKQEEKVIKIDVKGTILDRLYGFNHSKIDFHFRQNANDFVVDEVPLYEFSNDGEHLVLHVRKRNLSTFELVNIFSKIFKYKTKRDRVCRT